MSENKHAEIILKKLLILAFSTPTNSYSVSSVSAVLNVEKIKYQKSFRHIQNQNIRVSVDNQAVNKI